jgi:hypothetical protein
MLLENERNFTCPTIYGQILPLKIINDNILLLIFTPCECLSCPQTKIKGLIGQSNVPEAKRYALLDRISTNVTIPALSSMDHLHSLFNHIFAEANFVRIIKVRAKHLYLLSLFKGFDKGLDMKRGTFTPRVLLHLFILLLLLLEICNIKLVKTFSMDSFNSLFCFLSSTIIC